MIGWKVDLSNRLSAAGVSADRVEWDDEGYLAVVDKTLVCDHPDDGRSGLWVVEMLEDGNSKSLGRLTKI